MKPENLEWLHETLKRFGKLMKDEWAKNEALTWIEAESNNPPPKVPPSRVV